MGVAFPVSAVVVIDPLLCECGYYYANILTFVILHLHLCFNVIILDEEDVFSVKHIAASRFHRNQKLMADIFNDIVVPDLRTG